MSGRVLSCVCSIFVIGNFCSIIMDLYSLEDGDVGNIFVTQESRNIVPLVPNFDVEADSVMEVDSVPNPQSGTQYSDISDDEFCGIPCSQVSQKKDDSRVRKCLFGS